MIVAGNIPPVRMGILVACEIMLILLSGAPGTHGDLTSYGGNMLGSLDGLISVVAAALGAILVAYTLRHVLVGQARWADYPLRKGPVTRWLVVAFTCLVWMAISAGISVAVGSGSAVRYLHYSEIAAAIVLVVALLRIDRLTAHNRVSS